MKLTLNRPNLQLPCPKRCSRRCWPSSKLRPGRRGAWWCWRRRQAFCAGHDLKEMPRRTLARLLPEALRQCTHAGDAGDPEAAGAGDRAGARHRHRGGLPAGGDVRSGGGATRAFAVSGVNLGLFCSTPSVALSRNLSRKAAFEMLVTGGFISADEAQARAQSTASPRPRNSMQPSKRWWARSSPNRASRWLRVRSNALQQSPPAREGHRRRLRRRQPDHGLQHDGRERAGRRAGLHRQTPAALGPADLRRRELLAGAVAALGASVLRAAEPQPVGATRCSARRTRILDGAASEAWIRPTTVKAVEAAFARYLHDLHPRPRARPRSGLQRHGAGAG